DSLFANIGHSILKDSAAALRTIAQGLLASEVDFLVELRLAKIELQFPIVTQFQHAGERLAHFAAEPLQRPDHAFCYQLFSLGGLELTSGQNLVHGEIALLTLKTFVVLADLAAAFRAQDLQRAEIPRNHVALELFGFLHDMPGHILDLLHEFFAAEL